MFTKKHARLAAAVSAVIAPSLALAGVTGGTGQTFIVPTTGATALRAFTSAENDRGTYLVGTTAPLQVGASTYTLDTVSGQAYGIQNLTAGPATPPEPGLGNDRVIYQYHSTGSVNGVKEVVRAQLGAPFSKFPVSASNELFVMGEAITAEDGSLLTNGYGATVPLNNKPEPVIAYSDVRADQVFAIDFANNTTQPALNRQPTQAGYGKGRSNSASGFSGTNFQVLSDLGNVPGGLDPSTTRIRSESLAVVPFAIAASPGTGLDSLTEDDAAFLNASGRLQNGVNFNYTTRDIGSGTRNQGSNNLNQDPSWGSGERDRLATAVTTTTDQNGNPVTIQVGEEQNPRVDLDGVGFDNAVNEARPSAIRTFADKTSGSRGIRRGVTEGRMVMGILSVGDIGTRGLDINKNLTNQPVRVLGIDWNEDNSLGGEIDAGPTQPTAEDVTEGRYQMWSASQAVTVSTGLVANDTPTSRPIQGDIDDEALAGVGTGPGIARKLLDNITDSVGSGPSPVTAATPFDAVVARGFIPVQLMGVDKAFDGATQFTRTRSTDEQTLWNGIVGTSSGSLAANTDWARAGDMNGDIAAQFYKIYDVDNLSSGTGNVEIQFTPRIFLAGDFDGDGVRDMNDTASLALAYARTADYLAANTDVNSTAIVTNTGGGVNNTALDTSEMPSSQHYGLLAMSDLNGNGNVQVVGALGGGDDKIIAIERDDVRYFLWGATVDSTDGGTYTTATDRRELGVRLGDLMKNTSIATFNVEIQSYVGGALTQADADELKFEKRDVNLSGSKAFGSAANNEYNFIEDALLIDIADGLDYTSLDDQTTVPTNLVNANLDDANTTIGQEDMNIMNEALTTTTGVNDSGRVDHAWAPAWNKTGSLDIVINAASGTYEVPTGATLTITDGSLSAGGVADPFTDNTGGATNGNSLNIVNNSSNSLLITAGSKTVGDLSGAGRTVVSGTASLTANHVRQGEVVINDTANITIAANGSETGTSVIGDLAMASGASFDITNNAVVLQNETAADVRDLIIAGRNSGTWDGDGITSSTAAGDPAQFVVGYADNSVLGLSTFGGQSVSSSDVLVALVLGGDADLDGDVDIDDLANLLSGWTGSGGSGSVFTDGDFDYDGDSDIDDLAIQLSTWTGSASSRSTAYEAWASLPADIQAQIPAPTVVPEPSALALLGLGGLMLRRRRH